MHDGVGAPGPPGFAAAQRLRRPGFAQRLQHDEIVGEESVRPAQRAHARCSSRSRRRCPASAVSAVERRLDVALGLERESRRTRRPRQAPISVRARAGVTPSADQLARRHDRACARPSETAAVSACAASGASGSPNARAMRPSTVRAARTEICWPTIARTASSKPSNVPGTRKPGCAGGERAQRRGDQRRIAGEVERALHPRQHRRHRARERRRHRDAQRGLARRRAALRCGRRAALPRCAIATVRA